MNESSLAQLLSGILGRQVNAAPSMANGGVPYSPVQSAAPMNLSSLLLGMLFGGMGGGSTGLSGPGYANYTPSTGQFSPNWGTNQGLVVPTRTDYPASYYQQPTRSLPTQIPSANTGNQGFIDWIWTQMTGQQPPTQKPTVPQTGPVVDGKTYYPSPLPGSSNPTTNTQTPYPTSTVQPYQPGSFKPQPLPQMWNPSSFYPGYQGGGFFGGGFNSWQPWKTDPTGFQNAWTNRNNPPERLRAFDGGYSQLKDAINFQQGKPSTGPDSVAYTPAPTTYSPTITPSTVNSIDYPQNRGSMAKFFSNLFGGQR